MLPKLRILLGLAICLPIVLVGCESSPDDEVVGGPGGQLLISGSCVARQADRSITCQDDTAITGEGAVLASIVFDYRLGGVSRHTLQAGLGRPPRQVTAPALESGTWTILHRVSGRVGVTILEGERSYVVTIISSSDTQALLAFLERIAPYEEPFADGQRPMASEASGAILVQETRAALGILPPSTRALLLEHVRRQGGIDLELATAEEIRRALRENGGIWGLRTKLLLMSL